MSDKTLEEIKEEKWKEYTELIRENEPHIDPRFEAGFDAGVETKEKENDKLWSIVCRTAHLPCFYGGLYDQLPEGCYCIACRAQVLLEEKRKGADDDK